MGKTYSAKPNEVTRNWYLIDAASAPLGRVAGLAARYLQGKHKATYTPHIDSGDAVIIINARSLRVTGNKLKDKVYYRHSGYAGALQQRTLEEQLKQSPEKVVQAAVRGMLPKNKLQESQLKRLKVYVDDQHGHDAQQPKQVEVQ